MTATPFERPDFNDDLALFPAQPADADYDKVTAAVNHKLEGKHPFNTPLTCLKCGHLLRPNTAHKKPEKCPGCDREIRAGFTWQGETEPPEHHTTKYYVGPQYGDRTAHCIKCGTYLYTDRFNSYTHRPNLSGHLCPGCDRTFG